MLERPHFITIGSMKSATSALHEQLAAQDGLFMSDPKEPCFFSDDEVYARGVEWYESLFAEAPPDSLCGESSTHYTKLPTYPETVSRMKLHLRPETKLVYVMRHPIDRLVSQYVHEWTERLVSDPIDRALQTRPELVAYSRYAMQLAPLLGAFGPERILPVFSSQIRADPQAVLERVCRFIGYPKRPEWHEGLREANVSSQRMRRSKLRDALLGLPGLKQLRRQLVPQAVRDTVKGFWQMNARPELRTDDLRYLKQTFDRDLAILGRWLGIELDCDRFDRATARCVPTWDADAVRDAVPD